MFIPPLYISNFFVNKFCAFQKGTLYFYSNLQQSIILKSLSGSEQVHTEERFVGEWKLGSRVLRNLREGIDHGRHRGLVP